MHFAIAAAFHAVSPALYRMIAATPDTPLRHLHDCRQPMPLRLANYADD
jgi:hypothetical protein